MKTRVKRASIVMIFLLMIQSIVSGIAPIQTAHAEENSNDAFFDFASLTESSFSQEDGDGFVHIDWSLSNFDVEEAGQSTDFQSPVALVEQEGTLSSEEATDVAVYETTENGIHVTFNEAALEHPEAEGTVKLQVPLEEETAEEVSVEEGTEEGAEKVTEEEGTEESAEEEAAEAGTEEAAGEGAVEEEGTEETDGEELAEARGEEGTEEIAGEESTEANEEQEEAATSAASNVGPQVELGDIFTFDYFQMDGEDVTNGAEVYFDSQYQIQYAWDTGDQEVNAGDTATLELPGVFQQWENTPGQDIELDDGTVVGTFTINNGVLAFTFDENIEGQSVQNGVVGFGLEFDREKFTEEWEQEIDFDGDGEKDLTVVTIPNEIESEMEKEGEPDSDRDAREITWIVDITNGSDQPITNGALGDVLPDGVGEPGNFEVRELTYDVDGNETVGNEVDFNDPTRTENGFEMIFDSVPARGGYQVEYTTEITDYSITEFTNDATFNHDDGELEANTTVYATERSNPIQKSGERVWWDYVNQEEVDLIEWTIVVNENGVDIDNAVVHDELPAGLTVVDGSISVTNNGESVDIDTTAFPDNPLTLGSVRSDEVYTITFLTDYDWSEVNDGEYEEGNRFTNKTELFDGENKRGEDEDTVDVWRDSLLEKSGNIDDYNYEDKILSWEITVNQAGHPINDAVLTDTLPAGLGEITAEDIDIDGAEVNVDAIEVTQNNDGTQTVVINLGDIDSAVTVAYQTEVENFDVEHDFTNTANLGGEGIGDSETGDNETVNPPANNFGKSFEGIDYNAKTIDWQLEVNPIREAISELTITDTFPNEGMFLLEDTVEVTLGDEAFTNYTLEPIDGSYHNGFTITIDEDVELDGGQLEVNYTTSYDPDEVENPHTGYSEDGDSARLYINEAQYVGMTEGGHSFDQTRDANVEVRDDAWNNGKKEGNLVDPDNWSEASDRKIAWQVYFNYQEQNLGSDVSVTDTLDYEGEIIDESIKVSTYDVDPDGNTSMTDTVLERGEDYTVEGEGTEITINFTNDVTERYVIEFETTVPDISEENYVNDAVVKVGDNEYPYTSSVDYDKGNDFLDKQVLGHEGSEVYIGEELEWEIVVNESLSSVEGATLQDTISPGLSFVEDSLTIVTGTGEAFTEGEDYTLSTETNENGETVLDITFEEDVTEVLTVNYETIVTAEDGQSVNNSVEFSGMETQLGSDETEEITANQFAWTGGEFREDRGAIRILKVDSSGEPIESSEATFELYRDINGEKVLLGEYVTENGVLEIPNLHLGIYYVTETAAPDGYRLSDEEMTIEVDEVYGEEEYVIEEEFRNISDREIDIPVNKTWDDAENQDDKRSESIEVELLANDNGTEFDNLVLNSENNWEGAFNGLPELDETGEEITYTIEEVDVPEGYERDINGDMAEGFDITNSYTPEVTEISGEKLWEDANNQDGVRPESITVNLLADGEEIDNQEVTAEDNWSYTFANLPVYQPGEVGEEITYTVTEDSVEGYTTTTDGYDITNTHTPEERSVTVTKAWDDANNQDGKRSESVDVQLFANGEEYGDPITLSDENEWTHTWTELDVNEAGEEITYTVEELNVHEDYDVDINDEDLGNVTITNSYDPEVTDVSGTKIWDDADNQDGVRPESITVNLLANGEEIDSKEVTGEDDWSYEFTDLPQFEAGEEITYTVTEDEVAEYTTTVEGYDITNTHTPEERSVTVTKAWEDAKNQDGKRSESVNVQLFVNGEAYGEPVTLSDENEWTHTWTELAVNEAGEEITYTVEELDVPEDYDVDINDEDLGNITITNSYEPEVMDISGTKEWADNDHTNQRPDSITVNLLANGEEVDSVDVTAETDWNFEFEDVPKFADGTEITYTVEEEAVDGYVKEDIEGTAEDGFTIINRLEKVSVGDYVWFDENKDGLQDDTDIPIEGVVLTIEDEEGNPVTDVYGDPVEPTTTDENGYYIFENLPIDNTYIVRIDQEASAEALEGYKPTLEEVGDDRSIDSSTWFAVSRHLTKDGEHDPTLDFGFVQADPAEEPGKDPEEDPGKELGEEPGKDPEEDPGKEPGEGPGKDPEEDPGKETEEVSDKTDSGNREGTDESDGGTLPDTATSIFNLLFISLGLLTIGAILLIANRFRNRSSN
ncbi:Cna B-type domain-containing protein [Virgibacillus sp. NKC19-3]|uniref:Cna B-type domain-containing protein n=1 Tax=Virgibacillus saliphilus TaxID=2831674 RepID=UPI001C9B29B9|nr:Cna B-type domain-containing protein [Virgibacillus sp. NKC19-3]MBY7141857.1 Cna B-type domain-containing protein [Virgibacillus sp. NKC19-3]